MKKEYKDTQAVYEKLGEKYVENIKGLMPKEIFGFIDLLPENASILEVGCAGGRDAKLFLEQGFEFTGIDLVQKFIDIAKDTCPDGEFFRMDVLKELDFPDNHFDAVWSYATLHHFYDEDMLKALENINRILKPGGKFFLGNKLGDKPSIITDKVGDGERRFFNFSSKEKTIELLEKSGFKVLKYFIVSDDANREDVKWIRLYAEKV